jgi:hypothetical protein
LLVLIGYPTFMDWIIPAIKFGLDERNIPRYSEGTTQIIWALAVGEAMIISMVITIASFFIKLTSLFNDYSDDAGLKYALIAFFGIGLVLGAFFYIFGGIKFFLWTLVITMIIGFCFGLRRELS